MKKTIESLTTVLLLLVLSSLTVTASAFEMMEFSPADWENATSHSMGLRAAPARVVLTAPGDVNLDGQVDIEDVTNLINIVLAGQQSSNGDVTNDGLVDIDDVTTLINGVLSGSMSAALDVNSALSALHQIYQSMRQSGWTLGVYNSHGNFGISAYTLTGELMGEDMIMARQGYGWFWYEASYSIKPYYESPSSRSTDMWFGYYTWISNANYLLQNANALSGTMGNYIKGQAYAIRAYSYFMLAQNFARTYKGHESDPCVPLFTGTIFTGSTGQPRSTVAEVYDQIVNDINQAVTLLNGTTQQLPEHIGYAVALGIKARIMLVMNNWPQAYLAAKEAIEVSGKNILEVSDFMGMNDATAGNVMWGAQIPDEESEHYASFFSHMSTSGGYGTYSPKQITTWLHRRMNSSDARQAWWDPNSSYSTGGFVQQKFEPSNPDNFGGDYIWMRVEEMYLTAAEAACRGNMTTTAIQYLNDLMEMRDPNYSCSKTGNTLGALTTDETGSLLEEILIQRRIELWGEDGRIYTIRRLGQGFERSTDWGWPAALATGHSWYDAESYPWVLTIPSSEFNGNPYINVIDDQNPLGDYPYYKMHVSFAQSAMEMRTANNHIIIPVTLTRAKTQGAYTAIIQNAGGDDIFAQKSWSAEFVDGSATATCNIIVDGMELDHDYTCLLKLSQLDENSNDSAQGTQITTMRLTIHCTNGNTEGMNVSFTKASYTQDCSDNRTTVVIPISRNEAKTDNEYMACLTMEGGDGHEELYNNKVIFNAGSSTAEAYVYFTNMEPGQSYQCVLKLSPADVATGGAITQIPITVNCVELEDAGSADVSISIFNMSVSNLAVKRIAGTNRYYIENMFDELFYEVSYADSPDWYFTLNDNGIISPDEGYWDYVLQDYRFLYDPTNYGSYCYVEYNGDNTYTVYHLIEYNSSYYRSTLEITWNR